MNHRIKLKAKDFHRPVRRNTDAARNIEGMTLMVRHTARWRPGREMMAKRRQAWMFLAQLSTVMATEAEEVSSG